MLTKMSKQNGLKHLALLGLLIFLAIQTGDVWADETDILDLDFGVGFGDNESGIATVTDSADYYVAAMTLQPDGKYVLAGRQDLSLMVVRYNADGSLDTDFGLDGRVTTFLGDGSGADSVTIQPDGKIIVVGWMNPTSHDSRNLAVVRYLPSGELDTFFNADGIFTYDEDDSSPLDNSAEVGYDVALQADGKIFVIGRGNDCFVNCIPQDFMAWRLTPSGELDNTFDGDGVDRFGMGSDDEEALDLAIQADGKRVIAGYIDDDMGIARYTAAGNLDSSFDGNGKLRVTELGRGRDIAVQSDGKIWAVGSSNKVVRLDTDGSFDTSLGSGGIITLSTPSGDFFPQRVEIQPTGAVVFAGRINGMVSVIQLTADGMWDTTFGGGTGYVSFSGYDATDDLLLQPDGKIVILARKTSDDDDALIRLYPDGTLDNGGRVMTNFHVGNSRDDRANAVTVAGDGRIYAAGYGEYTDLTTDWVRVSRYTVDGELDPTFNMTPLINTVANDIKIDSNGRPVVVATLFYQAQNRYGFRLYRLTDSGDIDFTLYTFFGGTNAGGNAVLLQPDNKIIIGGTVDGDFVLARYDGENLDTTFGGQGTGYIIRDMGAEDRIRDLAFTTTGDIIAVGTKKSQGPTDTDVVVARFSANGIPDSGFGTGGQTITNWNVNDSVRSVVVHPDGKIIMAGMIYGRFATWRYSSQGILDISYGDATGLAFLYRSSSEAYDVMVQEDNKIVAVGCLHDGNADRAVSGRFLTNGTIDSTFANDGKAEFRIGARWECALGLAKDPISKDFIVVGRAMTGYGLDEAWMLFRIQDSSGGITAVSPHIYLSIITGGVQAAWDHTSENNHLYHVWRDNDPYFDPGDPNNTPTFLGIVQPPGLGQTATYADMNVAPNENYYYLVQGSLNGTTANSNTAGVFHFDIAPGS